MIDLEAHNFARNRAERSRWARWLLGGLLAFGLVFESSAVTRVALLDFTADDNSYPASQAARDFTLLLQLRLANQADVEWVEREQLKMAERELRLSDLGLMSGEGAVRRGKWVRANWLAQGRFAFDDNGQRVLKLQLLDLQRAELLAEESVAFGSQTNIVAAEGMLGPAVAGVQKLLASGAGRNNRLEGKVLIAPLFFTDFSRWRQKGLPLERAFREYFAMAAETNPAVRIVEFAKAYQSLDESALLSGGWVEEDADAWKKLADVYVWGTCQVSNTFWGRATNSETRLRLTFNVWNGEGAVKQYVQRINWPVRQPFPVAGVRARFERMLDNVLSLAKPTQRRDDASAVRKQIASSLIADFGVQGPGGHLNGLTYSEDDRRRFAEAVHMLEAACFFDPDNAAAQAHRISVRWGWWIDWSGKTKNDFWSHWRRSEEWGKYGEKFGLETVIEMPFPHTYDGLAGAYRDSLEGVLRMFGDNGKVESHGFPRDVPKEVEEAWKKQLEAEALRRRKAAEEEIARSGHYPKSAFAKAWAAAATNKPALRTNPPVAKAPVPEAKRTAPSPTVPTQLSATVRTSPVPTVARASTARTNVRTSSPPAVARASPTSVGVRTSSVAPRTFASSGVVRTSPPALGEHWYPPGTVKGSRPASTGPLVWTRYVSPMFRLPPVRVPLPEVTPSMQAISFPPRAEVAGIVALAVQGGRVWIVAGDGRASGVNAPKPDLAEEMRAEVTRVWTCDVSQTTASAFDEPRLPSRVASARVQGDAVWLGGNGLVRLRPDKDSFEQFKALDGVDFAEAFSIDVGADGDVFASGSGAKILTLPAGAKKWRGISGPNGSQSWSGNNPPAVCANRSFLALKAGSLALFDRKSESWKTNFDKVFGGLWCAVADETNVWAGGDQGLVSVQPDSMAVQFGRLGSYLTWTPPRELAWPAQQFNQGFVPGQMHTKPEPMEDTLKRAMKTFQRDREAAQTARTKNGRTTDVLELQTRLPGRVRGLANDGDFLWVNCEASMVSSISLLHKPSRSWVGRADFKERVSALAITGNEVWLGFLTGTQMVARFDKRVFTAIPAREWKPDRIGEAELTSVIQQFPANAQAVHAFVFGDYRTAANLAAKDPRHMRDVEALFLLAFSYDAFGLDEPEKARHYFEAIGELFPNSPWSEFADEASRRNEVLHTQNKVRKQSLAKFDRNHDGQLDEAEARAMNRDPEFAGLLEVADRKELRFSLEQVVARFDRNDDGKLDEKELAYLCNMVKLHNEASKTMPETKSRNPMLTPLLMDNFPAAPELIKRFDADHDGALDAVELETAITRLKKK